MLYTYPESKVVVKAGWVLMVTIEDCVQSLVVLLESKAVVKGWVRVVTIEDCVQSLVMLLAAHIP